MFISKRLKLRIFTHSTLEMIASCVLALLLGILASNSFTESHDHSSEPLMLLISFDGFRWDYLKTHNLSNFNYLKENGAYADYINNSFTTVTFPNHWTIVTGLHEETHGLVQNSMYDPTLNISFDIKNFTEAKVWYAQNPITEPIWITNQKASPSRHSAAEWVGSGVNIHNEQIIAIPYNKSTPYKSLVDQFIALYTQKEKAINFGAIYFDEPGMQKIFFFNNVFF